LRKKEKWVAQFHQWPHNREDWTWEVHLYTIAPFLGTVIYKVTEGVERLKKWWWGAKEGETEKCQEDYGW
jgi:hypothetical protein